MGGGGYDQSKYNPVCAALTPAGTSYILSAGYDQDPDYVPAKGKWHSGVDCVLSNSSGRPPLFRSVAPGKVLVAGATYDKTECSSSASYAGYGILAIYDGKKTFLYLHGKDFLVSPGQQVAADQLLGTQSNVTLEPLMGEHVHLEIREGKSCSAGDTKKPKSYQKEGGYPLNVDPLVWLNESRKNEGKNDDQLRDDTIDQWNSEVQQQPVQQQPVQQQPVQQQPVQQQPVQQQPVQQQPVQQQPVQQQQTTVVTSVDVYHFDYDNRTITSGLKQGYNPVIVVKGSNLPSTAVVNVEGYTCNINAPITASNFYKIGFYSTVSSNTSSGRYTYPSNEGYQNSFASVCEDAVKTNPISTTTTVKIEVKDKPLGKQIYPPLCGNNIPCYTRTEKVN